MRKAPLRIILICGAAVSLFAILRPGSRVSNSPLSKQMSAMRQIQIKLRDYDFDHLATETDNLKDKSIADLVAMNILSSADATYLSDHQIKFYGYDPNHVSGDVPLFEGTYPRNAPRWRIVSYMDGRIERYEMNDGK